MRDMCAEAAIAQPTSMNRVVQMEPIGTAAVCFRMLLSFLWHCLEGLEGAAPLAPPHYSYSMSMHLCHI